MQTVNIPGQGVAQFPDGMSEAQIKSVLAKQFPTTGEDIYNRVLSDPTYEPNPEEYKLFEDYGKTQHSNLLKQFAQGIGAFADIAQKAAVAGAEGGAINPLNYAEGFAQGTRNLYGLLAESDNPQSPLFRFKNLIFGDGTPEDRRQQFLKAREFNRTSQQLAEGKDSLLVAKQFINPDFVQGVSLIADPTLFLPGLGEAAGLNKLIARGVGLGVKGTGKAVNILAKPAERVLEAGATIGEHAGVTPELVRTATAAAGGATAAMGSPVTAAALLGAPKAVESARALGDILETAGENLITQPTRIGPIESIGLRPGASKLEQTIGKIGTMGGDTALDLGLRGVIGATEGATIGGGLGYWHGGPEGAAEGAGFGLGMGGLGGTVGRLGAKLTGKAALEARTADLDRWIAGQDPDTQAKLTKIRERDGVDVATKLIDASEAIKGRFRDVQVRFLNDAEFAAEHGGSARGVEAMPGDRPVIDINVDKQRTDATIGHEMFHALTRIEQLAPEMRRLKEEILSHLNEGEQQTLFKNYFDSLHDEAKADLAGLTPEQIQEKVFQEAGAEYLSQLVAGSHPDSLLRGFSGAKKAALDRLLMRNSSNILGRMISRLSGRPAYESTVFGGALRDAPPVVNAMLRDLVRARRNLNEHIETEKSDRSYKRGEAISPANAKELAEAPIPLVRQTADGNFAIRTDAELQAAEKQFNDTLRQVVDTTPIKDPTQPHMRVIDGEVKGEGFSPEQIEAIKKSALPDKVKEFLDSFTKSMSDGTVMDTTYGPASGKDSKGRTQYRTLKISDRRLLHFLLQQNKEGGWYTTSLNMTKAEARAAKLAKAGKLGPYASVDTFLPDFKAYVSNLSHGAGQRTKDFFMSRGDTADVATEKADFMHKFTTGEEKFSKLIASYRLDRFIRAALTDEKVPIHERFWERAKKNWMPSEKIGEHEVISSKEGERIIKTPTGKFKLFKRDGSPAGIFDTQAAAEGKAASLSRNLMPADGWKQRFEKDQQELNNIFGRAAPPKGYDTAFHLTKVIRRVLDNLDPRARERMAASAEQRGDSAAAARHREIARTYRSAMNYAHGAIADLTASLPEKTATDLRTGKKVDPFQVLKEHFPNGTKRPPEEILTELSNLMEAANPRREDDRFSGHEGRQDVLNTAEVMRMNGIPIDQRTMDLLFKRQYGVDEATKIRREKDFMRESFNPEFWDTQKSGNMEIKTRLPDQLPPDKHFMPAVNEATKLAMREGVSTSAEDEFFGEIWPRMLKKTGMLFSSKTKQGLMEGAKGAVDDVVAFLRDNPKFADYYNKDWQNTRSLLEGDYGRKLTDDEFLFYRLAAGLTSPGTELPGNIQDTVNVHRLWMKDGNLTAIQMGEKPSTGNRIVAKSPFLFTAGTGPNKANTLKIADRLIKEKGGVREAVDFLREPVTMDEVKKFKTEMGYKGQLSDVGPIKELVKQATGQDELIPRMFIFGKKVGAYTLNAIGDHRYNTLDVWESRFIRSYFHNLFKENTGIVSGVDEHTTFAKFVDHFNRRFEEVTGQKWETSALQAARWFFILDAARKAGYTRARTSETISYYTKRNLEKLRRSDPAGGQPSDAGYSGGGSTEGQPGEGQSGEVNFMPDPAIPGAESLQGFRILPSKGGRFRVYSPSGALIGVQASQEQARRLAQRKAQSDIRMLMPESDVPKPLLSAYEKGKADASSHGVSTLREFERLVRLHDAEYPDFIEDPAQRGFWEAGLLGHEVPRKVTADRIGDIPHRGQSFNTRDQKFEHGISVLRVHGQERSDVGTYDMFNPGDITQVEGFLLPHRTGADGEPLLVAAKQKPKR